jgi:hypothetical protein
VVQQIRVTTMRTGLAMLLLLLAACSSARPPQPVASQPAGTPALRFILSEAYDTDWELRVTTITGEHVTGRIRGFFPNSFQLDDARIELDDVMTVERRGSRGYLVDFSIVFGAIAGAAGYALTSGATGSGTACTSPCRERRIATYIAAGALAGGILGAILKPGQDHQLLWERE